MTEARTPELHPAPGRAIVRIVPRLGLVNEGFEKWAANPNENELRSKDTAIVLAVDGRGETQPMLGVLMAIGDPTNEREEKIAKWAKERAEAGDVFVFSSYGTGSPYWNDDMRKMMTAGYDFRWLQGLRLYDLNQLGATISGCGQYGELAIPPPSLIQVVQ